MQHYKLALNAFEFRTLCTAGKSVTLAYWTLVLATYVKI